MKPNTQPPRKDNDKSRQWSKDAPVGVVILGHIVPHLANSFNKTLDF